MVSIYWSSTREILGSNPYSYNFCHQIQWIHWQLIVEKLNWVGCQKQIWLSEWQNCHSEQGSVRKGDIKICCQLHPDENCHLLFYSSSVIYYLSYKREIKQQLYNKPPACLLLFYGDSSIPASMTAVQICLCQIDRLLWCLYQLSGSVTSRVRERNWAMLGRKRLTLF